MRVIDIDMGRSAVLRIRAIALNTFVSLLRNKIIILFFANLLACSCS
jgi:hypothetical protein